MILHFLLKVLSFTEDHYIYHLQLQKNKAYVFFESVTKKSFQNNYTFLSSVYFTISLMSGQPQLQCSGFLMSRKHSLCHIFSQIIFIAEYKFHTYLLQLPPKGASLASLNFQCKLFSHNMWMGRISKRTRSKDYWFQLL